MLEAERSHRDHAIVEQVIAELKSGPRRRTLRGLLRQRCVDGAVRPRPNLTRAAGVLASARHARARAATIREELIKIPARIATHARRLPPPPARELALAARLGSPVRRRLRPRLTPTPRPHEERPQWKSWTDRRASPAQASESPCRHLPSALNTTQRTRPADQAQPPRGDRRPDGQGAGPARSASFFLRHSAAHDALLSRDGKQTSAGDHGRGREHVRRHRVFELPGDGDGPAALVAPVPSGP